MSVTFTEIVLLVISAVVFVVSFLLPGSRDKKSGVNEEAAQEEIKRLVRQEVDEIRSHVEEVVEESMTYAMEKTERSLERLSNEKIMAVSEYSDTVMQEIHKSHEEVIFLYDMLNSKHENLKKTVTEASKAAKMMQDTVEGLQTMRSPAGTAGKSGLRSTETGGIQGLTGSKFPVSSGTAAQGKKAPLKETGRGEVRKTDALRSQRGEVQKKEQADGNPLMRDVISQKSTASRKEAALRGSGASGQAVPPLTERIAQVQLDANASRNSNDKILALHRKGKSNVAIARELGLGVGEVKLVIDLYKNL